ncbi:mandelate racemase/muconate lactonizing enzyme family protein [Neobacillus mesonae]|uniref:mandelate racemase/muconate lactonizing enzyme family protein n=1 Tax=Neobacillus mesonae TaxID=1193713 RepID=UPI002041D472|nr:dipeptide epimerase [Neobacillus mesonae]MCM3569392.1 dipeptide epimerase [Neobacillus mesonae]
MKITSATVYGIRLPFIEPFIISYHTYKDMPSVILELHTDEGITGYGEATPDEHVTGETFDGVIAVLTEFLIPAVIGEDPFNIEAIHEKMDKLLYENPSAKAAVDIACYDLMGKKAELPVYYLLGGRFHNQLDVPKVLSILEPEVMAQQAKAAKEEGYSSIKLKVGTDAKKDVERIHAVRSAVGPDFPIRVDANQGWQTVSEALSVIRKIEDCGIDWMEQPVVAHDIDALAEVRAKTTIPIMIDEGLHSLKEMREVIAKKAADKINIKLMKCGGLYRGSQLVHIAEMAGITCQVGSMVESSIATAAGLHLTTAKKAIQSHELVGPLMFSKDIAQLPFTKNAIALSDKPGLGIEIDKDALEEITCRKMEIK